MLVRLKAGPDKDNRTPFNTIAIALASSLIVIVLTSCSSRSTPASAKRELKELGISYEVRSLLTSAQEGNKRVLELLLDAGMDPNSKGDSAETALMEAAYHGHATLVTLLLTRRADVSLTDKDGLTALHRACAGPFSYPCVQILLDHGADPDARTINSETPIAKAVLIPLTDQRVERNNVNTVKALLERGADVNARFLHGFTPLMRAAIVGNPGMVRLLLDKGADVAAMSDDGTTAKDIALRYHNEAIARMIDKSIGPAKY